MSHTFYVLDRFGRVICKSAEPEVAKALAFRIAAAGAWCCVTADGVMAELPAGVVGVEKIGREGAFRMENPDDVHVDPDVLEKIVGPIDRRISLDETPPPESPEPPIPHG